MAAFAAFLVLCMVLDSLCLIPIGFGSDSNDLLVSPWKFPIF